MRVTLTIIKYRVTYILPALFAMALFRLPLFFNTRISFWKLLGSGKGGGFRKKPDWQQWAMLVVHRQPPSTLMPGELYGSFVDRWLKYWRCSCRTLLLEPIEGHGSWDGKAAFGTLGSDKFRSGERIAVLTRATIQLSKLKQFWKHVPALNKQMKNATGLMESLSIGELPLIKQATFSVWENMDQMKLFAYNMQQHVEVVKKTRNENWYREQMFVRFRILDDSGWCSPTQVQPNKPPES